MAAQRQRLFLVMPKMLSSSPPSHWLPMLRSKNNGLQAAFAVRGFSIYNFDYSWTYKLQITREKKFVLPDFGFK